MEVDYTEVRNPIRLGRKPSQDDGNRVRPRLLKVTVDGERVKKQILTKAKQLKTTDFKEWNNIYITPDLTFKERQQNRKLRSELNTRRENGENNLIIRNGRIVIGERSFRGTGPASSGRGSEGAKERGGESTE